MPGFHKESTHCRGPRVSRAGTTRTPDNFVFSIKSPRFTTHVHRPCEVEGRSPTQNPRGSSHHGCAQDQWMKDRSWFQIELDAPLRDAVEIRHNSFSCEEFIAVFRNHQVALAVAAPWSGSSRGYHDRLHVLQSARKRARIQSRSAHGQSRSWRGRAVRKRTLARKPARRMARSNRRAMHLSISTRR
jgi:hypothetical protein